MKSDQAKVYKEKIVDCPIIFHREKQGGRDQSPQQPNLLIQSNKTEDNAITISHLRNSFKSLRVWFICLNSTEWDPYRLPPQQKHHLAPPQTLNS